MIRSHPYILDLGLGSWSDNQLNKRNHCLGQNMTIHWIDCLDLVLRIRILKFSDLSNILRISIIVEVVELILCS